MHNYDHKKLIEKIQKLDEIPEDSRLFSDWIRADAHLAFLRENASADELVIYASGKFTFIHSVVVPTSALTPIDPEDLMNWSLNPYTSIASYVTGGGREGVWVERGVGMTTGVKAFEKGMQLIFGRTFEGWNGSGRNYFELHQEYSHITGIHWRPEMRAYCHFNELGDLESVVSVTTREDKGSSVTLVSFKWKQLEEYLVASNSSLVRMFDFTLHQPLRFNGWPNESPQEHHDSDNLFFRRQIVPNLAGYTRGIQIIRPRRPAEVVLKDIKDGWFGDESKDYAEFIAYDWRNDRITKISTNPSATANYFNAESNSLPFELSPAFFNPEVLLKYKTDRDKYTVGERHVSCRTAWHLEGIDVNEAGQVHAYICYLRRLPYKEQLHWLIYNEQPKANISERAFINDFRGEWISFVEPLQKVLSVIRHWNEGKVTWWTLRDENLLNRVSTPLTASRDEWAESFMDLAKLVVEGFETKPIRMKLDAARIPYQNEEKTIALLEKLLNADKKEPANKQLVGLRTVQSLRSKAKGHAGGIEAEQLARDALMEHETYCNHFRHVCTQVANDLKTIELLMK